MWYKNVDALEEIAALWDQARQAASVNTPKGAAEHQRQRMVVLEQAATYVILERATKSGRTVPMPTPPAIVGILVEALEKRYGQKVNMTDEAVQD